MLLPTSDDSSLVRGDDAAAVKQRRLFAGQLQRLVADTVARFQRTALSLPLSSGQDLACAFCDAAGRSIVDVGADPVLRGSLGAQVTAAISSFPRIPGREAMIAVNDPFGGGLDTGTLTLIAPLYDGMEQQASGYLALRGRSPLLPFGEPGPLAEPPSPPEDELLALPPAVGPRYAGFHKAPAIATMPRTVDDEGPRLPPTLLTDGLIRELARHGRSSRERLGDLLAQREALRYGLERLRELMAAIGAPRLRDLSSALFLRSAEAARTALSGLPDGVYAFADSLDDDAAGRTDIGIRATCILRGGQLQIDLRESDDAVPGPLNTVAPTAAAMARHVLARFLPKDVPVNDGLLAPVQLHLRPGSLLAAAPPAALALGVDETAWRLRDVLLGALAQAAPQKIGAAAGSTKNSLYLARPGAGSIHSERLASGLGGQPEEAADLDAAFLDGYSLAAEILERRLPVAVRQHKVRRGSGGGGIHAGSDGEVREFELLAELEVTLASERRRRPPYGLAGGGPGAVGRETLLRAGAEEAAARELPGKVSFRGRARDRLEIESPGGGGHGDPQRAAFFAALLS